MRKVITQKTKFQNEREPFVDDYLPCLLSHTHSLLTRRIELIIQEESITMNEFKVLTTLVGNNALSLKQLADMMHVKQSTLSRIVENMVKSKLLSRRDAAGDRRRIEIKLTQKGLDRITLLLKRVKGSEEGAEASLGATDSSSLKRILKKLIKKELLWEPSAITQNKARKSI
jgi:MarR family transcriptional regulator, organic hydroperoxide resistance regulator